jgi:Glycosyl hydrolase family 79 C-terminal beta domain
MRSRTAAVFLMVGIVAVAVIAAVLITSASSSNNVKANVTVSDAAYGRPIPAGFVGLSMEPRGLESYGGTNPRSPNPVFEQELRNLAPDQPASLRIGGDGTDWTWYPVPDMAQPPGVKFSLDQNWLGVARAVAQATDARLIVGVDLEANSAPLAAAEAQAMLSTIGRRSIEGLEIGNEPELYGTFSWYKTAAGVHVDGRPRGYDFTDYLHDYSTIAQAIPDAPLAGPATGAPKWIPELGNFLAAEPRVAVATLHKYPLKHCSKTAHVTIDQLLANSSSAGLADSVARYASIAHAHHVPLRIDEMNAVSCGGVRGVSDTFASALWALNTLFEFSRVGVDGVNFHTVPDTINELISADDAGGRWHSLVHPQYYGMMMFAQAAPPGARLLRISGASHGSLHVWATRAPDGQVRVVMINDASNGSQQVTLRIGSARGTAKLERLEAPSITASSGVTLGGQSFGQATYTGKLAGRSTDTSVAPTGGAYVVKVPAASAALLTLHG